MRLTTIKLSGFKSFVDPTTLHLPTNMTGVVGPNGCGKSNIIDAIRWVMGESAASRLRGDAITDVIFSGSGSRKPVGAATVELIFDNSDGLVAGEFARFNEISVKRMVSRDGQSSYFLNNSRCRRKDITDLFLGTGLGARSYSIIEQGMISQIIEAHPEELRVHLEEAAGISKYKERRKETESRIKATRENLDRLNDVREEVDKQIEHLRRQAKAAERWQQLKTEQNKVEAELRALNLREIQQEVENRDQAIREREIKIEALIAEQRQIEAQMEAHRQEFSGATEHFNKVQAEVYRIGSEIARVEQHIQHKRELTDRLKRAEQETETALAEILSHLEADRTQIELLETNLAQNEPKLEVLQVEADNRQEALITAEKTITDWQQHWDDYAKSSGESSRAAEVERTRIDYLDKQILDASRRLQALDEERRRADVAQLSDAAETLLQEQDDFKGKVESLTEMLDARKNSFEQLQEQRTSANKELNETRQNLQSARGRLASLEALQHAALGQEAKETSLWLKQVGLDNERRLGEVLEVQTGWESAVETVLAGLLEGVVLESPNSFISELSHVNEHNLALIETSAMQAGESATLAARVQAPSCVSAMLARVRTAESLIEAQSIASQLQAHESVITQDGIWLGAGWARVVRAKGAQAGVIARERELQQTQNNIERLQKRASELEARIDAFKMDSLEREQLRDDAQRDLYNAHRRLAEISGQISSQRGRLDAAHARIVQIESESNQLTSQLDEARSTVSASRAELEKAIEMMGDMEQERGRLELGRRKMLEAREEARMNAREAADAAHQIALTIESKRAALASLQQAIGRMNSQYSSLMLRKTEIATQLSGGEEPFAALDAERRTYLDQRLLVDKQLVEARKALEQFDTEMRGYDVERHRVEREASELRDALTTNKLDHQQLSLRAQSLADAIEAAGFVIETVIAELDVQAEPQAWAARFDDLEQKIKRLEPVNLAAIQEFAEQSERKNYLDAQYNDLTQALETLEGAIKKIDRETRTRFKETFDKVNQGLSELFPRLFGGGHAYLELTGEDMLSTGVTIMARPPGKRVVSITLLSGGEKALTAVALVFAIFRLNPAPFCLLDEVDAPLDEANVGRFSAMVKEMAETVQFLIVTHNKTTMEAAQQLCGVTMREPGVSRLVSVDLAEATKLAGAA